MDAHAPPLPDPAAAERLAAQLKAWSAGLSALARAGGASPAKVSALLDPLVAAGALAELGAEADAILAPLLAWSAAERAGRRQRLAAALKAGAAARGIGLKVLSKEPLELRLPPLSAHISVEGDRARLCFGREEVATCGASAEELFAAWATAREALEGAHFDGALLFAQLQEAARRVGGPGWVELDAAYAELVLLRQPPAFRRDPSPRSFLAYGRAQFIYDLWRLRRDRLLTQGGWRLSLAPATGGALRDKKRLFFLEDDQGEGSWHATLRFVEAQDG